jgi:hypothetical protein
VTPLDIAICGVRKYEVSRGVCFTSITKSDGRSILKSDRVAGMVPDIFVSFPGFTCSKGICLYSTVRPANWTCALRRPQSDRKSGLEQSLAEFKALQFAGGGPG